MEVIFTFLDNPEETHPLPADGDIPGVLGTFLQAGQAGRLHQGGEDVDELHQGLREHGLEGVRYVTMSLRGLTWSITPGMCSIMGAR